MRLWDYKIMRLLESRCACCLAMPSHRASSGSLRSRFSLRFAGQLPCKIHAKIDAEIHPNSPPGGSRETPNRVKIASGTLSGRPVAPRSIPKASRERLRSVSGRPRGDPAAPGDSPKAPQDAKKTAQERPGARRGDQNRRQVASRSENIELFFARLVRAASSQRFFDDFHRFSVDS